MVRCLFRRRGLSGPCHGKTEGMSLPELATRCRIVIVSVPIAATTDIIRAGGTASAGRLASDGLYLAEGRTGPGDAGRHAGRRSSAATPSSDRMPLPGRPEHRPLPRRGRRWLALQGIFVKNGARITVTAPAEHDRMMALIQGLTHLDTILMGLTLRDSGVEPSELEAFSTPVFRTKQAIIEKVFDPPRPLRGPPRGKSGHARDPRNVRNESLQAQGIASEQRRGWTGRPAERNGPWSPALGSSMLTGPRVREQLFARHDPDGADRVRRQVHKEDNNRCISFMNHSPLSALRVRRIPQAG